MGMPFEGVPWRPEITEEEIVVQDVPNDDLELQLVWFDAIRKYGLSLSSAELAELWMSRICHGCDEYSIAVRNLRRGIMPPQSGRKDNFFADGMGAAIRSEIWAALFPGRPDAAGYFAQQDAQVDHWGDGVRGEIFMAMAESAVCVSGDVPSALLAALMRLKENSRLYGTLKDVFELFQSGVPEGEACKRIIARCSHANFTDCVMNLAYIVFALLWGRGDFMKTILLAVNCGRDTDCTAASCGAFLGFASGMSAFPGKWAAKVRNELTVSDFVACIPGIPKTMDELAGQTVALHETLSAGLPEKLYPGYSDSVSMNGVPSLDASRWLVLDGSGDGIDSIAERLRETGRCPETLNHRIVSFDGLILNLSKYAHDYNTLNLFSFLHMENESQPEDDIFISLTADVGIRVRVDGRLLLNNHCRQKMMPSFHRTEGGAAFAYPVKYGERRLFHIQLFNCRGDVRCCVMFGNSRNDHLDGFRFMISSRSGHSEKR